jgi:hypothetical protein
MFFRLGGCLVAVLCASAWGQNVSQVFHFTNTQAPIGMQEITNAVRTVGEIIYAAPDFNAKTLTVTGTPAQIAIAAWIFSTLDQPAPANRATQEFLPAGTTNDVVRVMYLTHPQTQVSYQEIVNAVRTIPEITKVFPYSGQFAIVMRGTASQTAMAEWLFRQLDLTAGLQPPQSLAAHQYTTPGVTNDQVQVLFRSHPWTIQSMQEIVNAVRVIPQLSRVFPYVAAGAISVRGQPATLALATWLFGQLDQSAPASGVAPAEYQMPGGADDVTQVFHLGSGNIATLPNVVTAVRAASPKPVFPVTSLNALVMRGTATQVAAADLLIRQMGKP